MDWVLTPMDVSQHQLSIRGLGSVVAFSGLLASYLCVCLHMIANPPKVHFYEAFHSEDGQ